MTGRSETLGLAIAAGAVIGGLALYVSVTTEAKKRSAETSKQQNEASLRSAGEVPTFTAPIESPALPEPEKNAVSDTEQAVRKASQKADAELTTDSNVDAEASLAGFEDRDESPTVASFIEGITGGDVDRRNPLLDGAQIGEKASIDGLVDSKSGEDIQRGYDGSDGDDSSDGDDDSDGGDETDGEDEKESAPAPGLEISSADKLPTPGSIEELAVMREVRRHLSRLHSLLLRTDIPPAAREAELRKLESAMKRLSPATRRSMDELVKKGYAARVRGGGASKVDVTGESLDANEYGRKDDRPSDVKAVEARIKGLRATLGAAAPKSKITPKSSSGFRNRNSLPVRGSSTIRAIQPRSRSVESSGGGLPSVQSNDL